MSAQSVASRNAFVIPSKVTLQISHTITVRLATALALLGEGMHVTGVPDEYQGTRWGYITVIDTVNAIAFASRNGTVVGPFETIQAKFTIPIRVAIALAQLEAKVKGRFSYIVGPMHSVSDNQIVSVVEAKLHGL